MNEKKIVKIFGGIDEKYIREANEDMNFWLESQEVVVVRVDGSRKFTWRTIIASVACTAAALFGVFALMLNVGKIGILEKPESYTEASDPMTNMSGNQSNNTSGSGSDQKVLGSYSFGFNQGDVDFSTDKLVLTPTVTGDEYPTILGVMAFVDGFPQKYSLNPSTEKKTLSVIETTPSKVGYDLNLDPKFDMELDAHYATMLYILDPDFKPENGNSFGMHHSASHWYSQPINTNGKELQKADVNALKTKSVPFSKKQTEQYNISTDEERGSATAFKLYQEWKAYQITLNGDKSPELTFAAYTTGQRDSGDYRVTFYINHELCTFNSGYNCLDLTLEGGKIVETKVVLDKALTNGDIVYCIAIPLFEGGLTEKSNSEMVFDSDQSDSKPNESNTTSDENINGINFRPQFAISDKIYFLDNRDKISLISSTNGSDVEKTLQLNNPENISAHGDHISVLINNGGEYVAKLYDNNLKEIKSADLSALQIMPQGIVDFDNDRIVYTAIVDKKTAMYSCDWNLQNKRKLMELPCEEYPLASYFDGISLSKNFVAFTASGNEGDIKAGFYGICDFNGNYEIRRKDGIAAPQTNDTTAMWQDKHTNINLGKMPSGTIEIYKDGSFSTLITEEITESHRAFLLNSGEVITATESGNWNLRKYSDNRVVRKIGIREETYIASVVEFNGKIYGYVSEYLPSLEKSESNCLVWESD